MCETKRCTICRKEKPLIDFYLTRNQCKSCFNKKNAAKKRSKSPHLTNLVYLINTGRRNVIKVGSTRKLIRRMGEAQTWNFDPVSVVHLYQSSDFREVERHIHSILAPDLIRGEWYHMKEYDIEAITQDIQSIYPDTKALLWVNTPFDTLLAQPDIFNKALSR